MIKPLYIGRTLCNKIYTILTTGHKLTVNICQTAYTIKFNSIAIIIFIDISLGKLQNI